MKQISLRKQKIKGFTLASKVLLIQETIAGGKINNLVLAMGFGGNKASAHSYKKTNSFFNGGKFECF